MPLLSENSIIKHDTIPFPDRKAIHQMYQFPAPQTVQIRQNNLRMEQLLFQSNTSRQSLNIHASRLLGSLLRGNKNGRYRSID
jgi:hypothetical protein